MSEAPEKALESLSLKDSATKVEDKPAATATDATSSGPQNGEEKPSAPQPMQNASLYVGELNLSVTEAILFEIFSTIGSVASIRVCRDAVTRESLGYAYINYHNPEDARKALDQLNYAIIKGRPCRIMWSQRDPSVRKSGKGNIFIKNLDPSIDNKALHDTFNAFGDILSCKVVTNPQGQSLGFGFIHFATPEAADQAIETVNGMVLNDRAVYVAHHVPRNERESQAEAQKAKFTNVYVKNLDRSLNQQGLEELFGKFGKITSALLATDAEGKSKGFGFINYEGHEAAQKAVEELNDTDVEGGKKLYVGRAQNKFERQSELKKQYEQARLEKLTKYQGINLYVKNLDDSVDDEKLREIFSPFGSITSVKVMTDDEGKSRGFGFVCYSSPEEANRAIAEMNQHMVANKPLYVALAQRKDLRQSQMRQQLNARNQLRLQQQAGLAGGLPGQFMGAPLAMYPGQTMPFAGRVPFPANPQMIIPPRGAGLPPLGQRPGAPAGQWQAGKGAYPPAPAAGYPAGAAPAAAGAPASQDSLRDIVSRVPAEAQKQVIGEALYPKILVQPEINSDDELAGKITGMLLDMDNNDLFALAEDDASLKEQVEEALVAYKQFLESQGEEAK